MALKDIEGFNVWEVFRHPKKTVQTALEFPNILTAVALLVIPWVLGIIVPAILGLNVNFAWNSAASAVSIALFFVQAVIIFWIAKKSGNKEKRLFEGVVSALSLTQIASIILLVFSFIFLLLNPQIVALTNEWIAGSIQTVDFTNLIFESLSSNVFGIIALVVGFIFSIYFSLQVLYLNYLNIKESTGRTVLASIIIMVIVLFVIAFLKELVLSLLQVSFVGFFLP